MQSLVHSFSCRKTLVDDLAALQVEPMGYGDRGRLILRRPTSQKRKDEIMYKNQWLTRDVLQVRVRRPNAPKGNLDLTASNSLPRQSFLRRA